MTLNDLIKQVPEDLRDCMIRINLPETTAEEAGDYPLIQVSIEQVDKRAPIILLEADYR